MFKIFIILISIFTLIDADTIQVSTPLQSLDRFPYETPHEKKITIPNNTQTVIISYEKDTGKMVNTYLQEKDPTYLSKIHAVFIVDIHKMPSIITTLFAMPKMRKYEHTIYVYNDKNLSVFIPPKEDKVTIIKFENNKVKSITYISTKSELQRVLEN